LFLNAARTHIPLNPVGDHFGQPLTHEEPSTCQSLFIA
jgi:hypothetical protein